MYLQDDLGGFGSLSTSLAINGSLRKKKDTTNIANDASERRINNSELIPEEFSTPPSPLADQTPSRVALAGDAEAVREPKSGEAEKRIRWLVESSSRGAGRGCRRAPPGWLAASAEGLGRSFRRMEKQPDSNRRGMGEPRYKAGAGDTASVRSICLHFMVKRVLSGGRRAVSLAG